jgi:hypothetical protein
MYLAKQRTWFISIQIHSPQILQVISFYNNSRVFFLRPPCPPCLSLMEKHHGYSQLFVLFGSEDWPPQHVELPHIYNRMVAYSIVTFWVVKRKHWKKGLYRSIIFLIVEQKKSVHINPPSYTADAGLLIIFRKQKWSDILSWRNTTVYCRIKMYSGFYRHTFH